MMMLCGLADDFSGGWAMAVVASPSMQAQMAKNFMAFPSTTAVPYLVSWFRSSQSLISSSSRELRNQNDTRIQQIASVLQFRNSPRARYRDCANFGIGTLAGICDRTTRRKGDGCDTICW